MSKPRQVPLPWSGVSSPHSIPIVVVLPEPLGPRKPKIVTRLTCIDQSRTTTLPAHDLVSPCTSMTMSGVVPWTVSAAGAAALIATPPDVNRQDLGFARSARLGAPPTRRLGGRRATRRAFPAAPRPKIPVL